MAQSLHMVPSLTFFQKIPFKGEAPQLGTQRNDFEVRRAVAKPLPSLEADETIGELLTIPDQSQSSPNIYF